MHFTTIKLEELTGNAPKQNQVSRIRKHLSSIHRKFILNHNVEIVVNGETLKFEQQKILKAPRWDDENGKEIEWIVPIDSTFGKNKRVTGFVALLDVMSTSVHNGFHYLEEVELFKEVVMNFLDQNNFREQMVHINIKEFW